ncbi:hypothetical protein Tco_0913400 [Tanacetum coccineum]
MEGRTIQRNSCGRCATATTVRGLERIWKRSRNLIQKCITGLRIFHHNIGLGHTSLGITKDLQMGPKEHQVSHAPPQASQAASQASQAPPSFKPQIHKLPTSSSQASQVFTRFTKSTATRKKNGSNAKVSSSSVVELYGNAVVMQTVVLCRVSRLVMLCHIGLVLSMHIGYASFSIAVNVS